MDSPTAVAVMEAGSYSSNSTPSLGTSICCGSGPRKWQKTKQKTHDIPYVESKKKIQKTSEYNKKEADSGNKEDKPEVTGAGVV